MIVLAGQLNRLKEVPQSDALCGTINEFPNMMERSNKFYSDLARKLDRYVSIFLKCILH